MAKPAGGQTHTASQTYLSSRGGDYHVRPCITQRLESRLTLLIQLSFETVVMRGLAADGGLFLPEEIPIVNDWVRLLHRCPSLYGSLL